MHNTRSTKGNEIKRNWYVVDVQGKILGRIATEIAQLLMGKAKPYFVRHLDCGDFVVVINASSIVTTGKKDVQKIYTSYSGYPGGLKKVSLGEMKKKNPGEVVRHAVSGMLPQNKLRDQMLTRLFIYADANHPHKDKLTVTV